MGFSSNNITNIRLTELSKRIYWFINIRWLAVIGVIAAINFAKFFQNLPLPYTFLYLLSGILTVFNVLYLSFYNYCKNRKSLQINKKLTDGFANFQVLIDLVILTLLLYGSGGLHSPFIYYYTFHTVIASMLLSAFWAFAQGGIAVTSFSILIILSSYHFIPSYHLEGFGPQPGDEVYFLYVTSKLGCLFSTIFILIFMTSSISKHLNKKEALLENANKDLTLANEEKSRYILQVTHELRTPLAAIQGYLKVALEGYIGPVEGKLKEMLQNINNRASNMLEMVNELLDLAYLKRPEKNNLEKELCNLKNQVNRALHLFQNELTRENMNVQTKIDDNTEALVNIEQFHILLTNIISNAIRYSGPESRIEIEALESNKNLLIKIKDYGIGIPDNDIKNIFQEYFRAQNAINKVKNGTGLGLAIVQNIIEKHNGKIWTESKLGKGTTFFIELPY